MMERAETDMMDAASAGDACDEAKGEVCAAPLYCRTTPSERSCATKGQGAPHILSARFDGLQPSDTVYVPSHPEGEVTVSLTAANGKLARLILLPKTGEGLEHGMEKAEGGEFYQTFLLPQGFEGRLIVQVEAADGSTNSLVKYIGAR
jgi:hypothetical protein